MASPLFGGSPRQSAKDRAAAIKDRITVLDLARARQAGVILRENRARPDSPYLAACDCPACHGAERVSISGDRQTWACGAPGCGAKGDVITFEMAATGADFASACAALERRAAAAPRDHDTSDLFAGKG